MHAIKFKFWEKSKSQNHLKTLKEGMSLKSSAARNFDIYMETVEKGDIPWNQFYIGLSTLAILNSFTIF
jgi:hypothetical protein